MIHRHEIHSMVPGLVHYGAQALVGALIDWTHYSVWGGAVGETAGESGRTCWRDGVLREQGQVDMQTDSRD